MNRVLVQALKDARLAQGLKQRDVADALGVNDNTLSGWENGRTEPDLDTLIKLCEIYKLNCADLLEQAYELNVDPPLWYTPLTTAYKEAEVSTREAACRVLDISYVDPGGPTRRLRASKRRDEFERLRQELLAAKEMAPQMETAPEQAAPLELSNENCE